ncbi:unnamed protein product [Meganyctiphanes norvegica]|uniref:Protein quiver n=1 Tax=Meganyctiphanes norvegica TaxID=48144 RepID=A0AAV2QF42_MEGNR
MEVAQQPVCSAPLVAMVAVAHSHKTTATATPSFTLTMLLMLIMLPAGCLCIDCYQCSSINGDDPSCEDPFHTNFTSSILHSPCMAGRKNRAGLFPATTCIKMAGRYSDTGETIMVRTCALDSGTLTTDTEIIRMSHCGSFYFEDRYVKGCLQSCEDADGCNHAARLGHQYSPILMVIITFLSLMVPLDVL